VKVASPIPKRSDQRRRTNSKPAQKVASGVRVKQPAADKGWHPAALAWYKSLAESGQAQFYEPSDWQTAKYTALLMTRLLTEEKLNAASVSAVTNLMNGLLTTEAARRRLQIEVEREQSKRDVKREASEVDNVIAGAFAQA
jgi:hypothetical protein